MPSHGIRKIHYFRTPLAANVSANQASTRNAAAQNRANLLRKLLAN
jgi:hypothetical protein